MSENLWGEEEPFSDMPEEAQTTADGKPKPVTTQQYAPPHVPAARQPQPNQQDAMQKRLDAARARVEAAEAAEAAEEDVALFSNGTDDIGEEDFEDVLSDAHLRLEQGSLYKMIMNHDLFNGVDADAKAVQNVQREIRAFARERMEVMLGMRAESSPEATAVVSPFNDLEVEVLKRLASKATNGATETEEANQVATSFKQAPKKNSINPIGTQKKAASAASAPKKGKALPSKPAAPVARQKTKQELLIEQIAREEGVPVEALELNVKGVGGKPIDQMTPAELEERNRLAAARRGTQVKSTTAVPMASYDEQLMRAQSQFSAVVGNSSQMARLIETVKAMPIKNP